MAVMLMFVCRIIYAGNIAMPYPKNPKDVANIALTEKILGGSSPYRADSVERAEPDINCSYPFLNSLLAVWIINVFKVGTINAHFLISLFSILLSGHLGYMIMKRYSDFMFLRFLAGFLFMLCHWNHGFISSLPDDLGLFLYVLTIFVMTKEGVRSKPMCLAILVTLCFYTLPICALVIVPAIIYLLIRSRKDVVKFILWIVGINSLIVWFISAIWPLYWTRVFIIPYLVSAPLKLFAIWIIRLLAPPVVIILLKLIGNVLGSDNAWLDFGISSMAVIISVFIGFFMLPIHILTENEIDAWNRALEYTRSYSTQGQVYYAACLAYDWGFDTDKGDCLCSDTQIVSEEIVKLPSDAQRIVEQDLAYKKILQGMAHDWAYALISFEDEDYIFNDKNCEEYGYSFLERIALQTGNESHTVTFYNRIL